MSLLLISFIAGAFTVVSPCVLPLLPVIIGGSVGTKAKDRWRPVIITVSLAASITIFTLILKFSTALISVPPSVWSTISGAIVLLLGIVTLFPELWEKISTRLHLSDRSNKMLAKSGEGKSHWSSVLIGVSLGPVFSSCSPTYALILATVLPQSFGVGVANLIAYSLGLSALLLLIAVFGQALVKRLKWAANPHGWFRKIIGALFIVVGLSVMLGIDKQIETYLVETGNFDLIELEMQLLGDDPLDL